MKARIDVDPLFWVDLKFTRKGVEVAVWKHSVLHRVVYPTTLRTVGSALAFVRGVVPGFKQAERQGRVLRHRIPQAA